MRHGDRKTPDICVYCGKNKARSFGPSGRAHSRCIKANGPAGAEKPRHWWKCGRCGDMTTTKTNKAPKACAGCGHAETGYRGFGVRPEFKGRLLPEALYGNEMGDEHRLRGHIRSIQGAAL